MRPIPWQAPGMGGGAGNPLAEAVDRDAGVLRTAVGCSPGAAPMRVLVVDDHDDAALALSVLAELWGYEVAVAHSGHEALMEVASFAPDVVLLDIGLPGLNGYDTARHMRRREARLSARRALIVAVTAHGSSQDRDEAWDAGIDHHLLKPSNHQVLERILAQHARRLADLAVGSTGGRAATAAELERINGTLGHAEADAAVGKDVTGVERSAKR